jgi:hypothetical protein
LRRDVSPLNMFRIGKPQEGEPQPRTKEPIAVEQKIHENYLSI